MMDKLAEFKCPAIIAYSSRKKMAWDNRAFHHIHNFDTFAVMK